MNFQIGTLLYCTIRGQTTCCFHNHHCDSFDDINKDFSKIAKHYMQNKVIHSMISLFSLKGQLSIIMYHVWNDIYKINRGFFYLIREKYFQRFFFKKEG